MLVHMLNIFSLFNIKCYRYRYRTFFRRTSFFFWMGIPDFAQIVNLAFIYLHLFFANLAAFESYSQA